jgi:NADH-quinone oxidoreductase subunit K
MFILQISLNTFLFFFNLLGIIFNRRNIILILMCIELVLLNLNLNFILFSVYLNDLYGQIFALIILTIAASESAIGLAIIITNYRIRGNISLNLLSSLKQ